MSSITTSKTYYSLVYMCICIDPNTHFSQNSIICNRQKLAHKLIQLNKLTVSITHLL